MLFPTKLTSLINTRGLIDSASLENHHNKSHNSGSHKWPKTFWGRCVPIMFISYIAIMKFNSSKDFVCLIGISSELGMFAYENIFYVES